MARLRPASPSVSSMNSRTSRPRSPISPTTTASQVALARQHGQQHRLADARTREHAQTLAAAAGGEHVERPDPEVQPLADPAAGVGRRRGTCEAGRGTAPWGNGPLPSMGAPKASMIRPRQASVGRTASPSGRMRISAPGATPSTAPKGISRARVSRKPTTSAGSHFAPRALDVGAGADGQPRQAAPRLDQQAVHRRHAPGDLQGIDPLHGGDQVAQRREPRGGWDRGHPGAAALTTRERRFSRNRRRRARRSHQGDGEQHCARHRGDDQEGPARKPPVLSFSRPASSGPAEARVEIRQVVEKQLQVPLAPVVVQQQHGGGQVVQSVSGADRCGVEGDGGRPARLGQRDEPHDQQGQRKPSPAASGRPARRASRRRRARPR